MAQEGREDMEVGSSIAMVSQRRPSIKYSKS